MALQEMEGRIAVAFACSFFLTLVCGTCHSGSKAFVQKKIRSLPLGFPMKSGTEFNVNGTRPRFLIPEASEMNVL
jgi:hypothetical protein